MRASNRFACLFFAVIAATAADRAPSWLEEISTRSAPEYGPEVPAVVLFRETKVSLQPDGKILEARRYAVRILSRAGFGEAVAMVPYNTDSGKVRALKAWTICPGGRTKRYDKKDTVDIALVSDDLYNQQRARVISAESAIDPGSVFGYESLTEKRSVFTQFEHQFQNELPTLVARFVLELPGGWRVEPVSFNGEKIASITSGSTWTWQVTNLQPIFDEAARPPVTALAPRLALTCYPPAGGKPAFGPVFSNWKEVSLWLTSLNDPQATLDEALRQKARELTAGEESELGRIQAVASFVQDVRYVSIQMGLNQGGGYRPHPASQVLSQSYGDCKDKVTLMRALLAGIGIASYPTAIFSGDSRYVRPEWPSPHQFNHQIVGVKVSPAIDGPAVKECERTGRLLFFDPTNEHTPLGFLPQALQDSYALVVAGDNGSLVKMPTAPAAANRLRRDIQFRLSKEGDITADVQEYCSGESAAYNRRLFQSLSTNEYRKVIERWVADDAGASTVEAVEAKDSPGGGFDVQVKFRVTEYGRSMRDQLLIFKPSVVSRRDRLVLTEADRSYPVLLRGNSFEEEVTVHLPEGFVPDELPPPARMSLDFGSYASECRAVDSKLHCFRRMELRSAVIPVAEYESVRSFFTKIYNWEKTPVVLVRR